MNLLKQTALILGLASLSLGGWTLVRDWRNKVSIVFSLVCFVVSVWSLSFVSHVTLFGRLSYDIHLFCNVLLVPLTLELLSRIFLKEKNKTSSSLLWVSLAGTFFLGVMILFSLGNGTVFRWLVLFWPLFIFAEFLHIIALDALDPSRLRMDSVSKSKKMLLYFGLGVTLCFCTFDHIPVYGYTLPALGNLLFTLFLFFASQVIVPQRLPGLEALASRFLAVLTLSLVITGFFALLYSYISATFPLFLLNSFLISFAVLALWGPLLTFFRYVTRRAFSSSRDHPDLAMARYKIQTEAMTDLPSVFEAAKNFSKESLGLERMELEILPRGATLPLLVASHFEEAVKRGEVPVLYRGFVEQERDQVLTYDRKQELDLQLQFLKTLECDLLSVTPVDETLDLRVRVREQGRGGAGTLARFNQVLLLIDHLAIQVTRVGRIKKALEKDRLVLLGEMAAGLAHEIRNPLGAIRGAVNLIEPDPGPWGRVIREEVDRLNRLVSQFLDFSRDQKENRETVDFHELVLKVVSHVRAGVPSSIELVVTRDAESSAVSLIPDSVQQVITNLIQNSIKALDGHSSPRIGIHLGRNAFEISDNGFGMDSETLKRVFDPFFTSFKEGSGLGLSICENLVRFDRGGISIESRPGFGTKVRVEYPNA